MSHGQWCVQVSYTQTDSESYLPREIAGVLLVAKKEAMLKLNAIVSLLFSIELYHKKVLKVC